jgi:hypothetical protein
MVKIMLKWIFEKTVLAELIWPMTGPQWRALPKEIMNHLGL